MGTRFGERPGQPGKLDKPPYRIRPGKPPIKADKTNPDNWTGFEEAVAACERGEVDAVGFVLTEDDPHFAADLDRVLDHETGEIHPDAHKVIHALDSYTELSISGRGLHIIGRGSKPAGLTRCKSRALGFELEVYDHNRFLVMTGNRLASLGSVAGVEDRADELEALCRELWPPSRSAASSPRSAPHDVDDAELLERARRARTGPKFRALYDRGEVSGYASGSEADYALINMLIFWTAGERERVVRLFEGSALYRPHDKHRDYLERSVQSALASYTGPFYKPRRLDTLERDAKESALAPYLRLLLDPTEWRGQRGASAYKAFAAAVALSSERGIDADGTLRLGCDVRTLAEVAGLTKETLKRSALPYLITDKKLLRWRGGKGRQAGELVLTVPIVPAYANKVIHTYSIGVNQHTLDDALETLRLLIRMRSGRSKRARLARLGMVAMFCTVALCAGPVRGQTIEALADATGRRKPDLRRVLRRLKSAGIVREPREDFYLLTDAFRAEYQRELTDSGITESERLQRERHRADRQARDEKLAGKDEPQPTANLRGKEAVEETLKDHEEDYRRMRIQDEMTKVGETALTYLTDAMGGWEAAEWRTLRDGWRERGGKTDALRLAVLAGPFSFGRVDGQLYVGRTLPEGCSAEGEERVSRLVGEGMLERIARLEVYGPDG
jgi:hypothetical protein